LGLKNSHPAEILKNLPINIRISKFLYTLKTLFFVFLPATTFFFVVVLTSHHKSAYSHSHDDHCLGPKAIATQVRVHEQSNSDLITFSSKIT
jgi:hypothetical protein